MKPGWLANESKPAASSTKKCSLSQGKYLKESKTIRRCAGNLQYIICASAEDIAKALKLHDIYLPINSGQEARRSGAKDILFSWRLFFRNKNFLVSMLSDAGA